MSRYTQQAVLLFRFYQWNASKGISSTNIVERTSTGTSVSRGTAACVGTPVNQSSPYRCPHTVKTHFTSLFSPYNIKHLEATLVVTYTELNRILTLESMEVDLLLEPSSNETAVFFHPQRLFLRMKHMKFWKNRVGIFSTTLSDSRKQSDSTHS